MKRFIFWIFVGVGAICVGVFIKFFLPENDRTVKKFSYIQPTLPIPAIRQQESSSSQIVFVPRVIDGDTIVVETVNPLTGVPGKQETVRYIGMDTPETVDPNKPVECYGHEASERNRQLVEGKYVRIEKDVSDRDKYGRLLRFVYFLASSSTDFSSTTSVDLELVEEGYARVLTIPPNVRYENEFQAAADIAKADNLGFWGHCPEYPFTS